MMWSCPVWGAFWGALMKYLMAAVAVVMVLSGANAESPAPTTSVTSVGTHTCEGFYPEAARQAQIGGVIGMAFKITPTGTVSEVAVVRSSGNGDLDEAAKSCVRTWRYLPAQENGKPVAAAWNVEVVFKPEPPALVAGAELLPVMIEQDRKVCMQYPFWALRHHAEGNTDIAYTVVPDGSVSGITVTKTSGDKDLDDAAKACVNSFKFRPLPAGTAPKPASAKATWSYIEHGISHVWWAYGGTTTASLEAGRTLRGAVDACLKKAAGHAEFASGFDGTTMILLHYVRDTIKGVSVLQSSGNDGLDRLAADCFRSEAKDHTNVEAGRRDGFGTFSIVWRQVVPF